MAQNQLKRRTGLVLAGGGTRGAYEVGVVHYIRSMLPKELATRLHFNIQSGSSVGGINSAFMASSAHDPVYQGAELLRLWSAIRNENIYRRGPVSFGRFFLRTIMGVAMHIINVRGFRNRHDQALHFQGIFDTEPFLNLLLTGCRWSNIAKNLEAGYIDAITISATNMMTGDLELFVQKRPELPYSKRMLTRFVKIGPRHVMASAAIPILFPPVPIHGTYYNDGGMRLTTPLAPAVSLGASRILLIGTRYIHPPILRDVTPETNAKPMQTQKPTLGDLLGKVLNSILLDRVDADRDQLDRINRILRTCEQLMPKANYDQLCDTAGIQQIETLSIFPSQDIALLVDETVRGNYRQLKSVGMFERFVLRLLEADEDRGRDLLSYLLFEPTYLKKLIDLGFEDARAKHDELCAFAERAIADKEIN
jgi:NTE family protein